MSNFVNHFSNAKSPSIVLDALDEHGIGVTGRSAIIVPWATGIAWTNQVGGHACYSPEVEGLCFPCTANWPRLGDPLYDYSGGTYKQDVVLQWINAQIIGRGRLDGYGHETYLDLMHSDQIGPWLRPLSSQDLDELRVIGHANYTNLYEAWIPLIVDSRHPHTPAALQLDEGDSESTSLLIIATYVNSD